MKILEEIFEEKIDFTSIESLKDLDQWDSVTRVRLIVFIEEDLGRTLTDYELENIHSLQLLNSLYH